MSSTMRTCGICGLTIRSAGDQPAPEGPSICASPTCQAELARSQKVNTPPPKPQAKAKK